VALVEDSRGAAFGPNRRKSRRASGAQPSRSGETAAPAASPSRRPAAFRRQLRRSSRRLPQQREDRCRLARLSRTPSRRHRPRRADQDRLDGVAAGPAMAPAGRTGLVVFRGPRRPHLHPGAARVPTRSSPATTLTTGKPVWAHRDRPGSGSRMAAPVRARRPPSSNGRVYTFGATGILNALDAVTAPSCGRATRRPTPA
jgi:hypothetical protein